MAQRNAPPPYERPPEPREQPSWARPNYEPPPRQGYEPPPPERERAPPPQVSNGYDYPGTAAPHYGAQPAYSNEPRYGPPPASMPSQHNPVPAHYEAQERERQMLAQQQQQRQAQAMHGAHLPERSYQAHESPQRRPMEESQPMQQQRSFLGVQEINRKGRLSPLPQAVQGAQGQHHGPGGEPSIKNEFGRMFSGIGSGVSGLGAPSPVSAGPQGTPFSMSGRREDFDNLQESPVENGGHKIPRSASRGGRRRKLKEEDSKGDDESSTGRRTPSGSSRGKRPKTHHHHSHPPHHHHHHRPREPNDITSSPAQSNLTPFKSISGSTIPSPPGQDSKATPTMHHHHIQRHHHHHVTPTKPVQPINTVIPLPKITVKNQAVLDAVADKPRKHLGHGYYEAQLKPRHLGSRGRHVASPDIGFASTPVPLPRFDGQENCTFTIKIPRSHLTHRNRQEVTERKAVWGTDVYTDDSDIIAACIHQGWFRGAWAPDVDISLLGLEISEPSKNSQVQATKTLTIDDTLFSPPSTGPWEVPDHRDCHVTVIVLPTLEKYTSTTRFGLRSREWGGKHDGYQNVHDGVSFMIYSLKWVEGVDGEEGRGGLSRRKIVQRELEEGELAEEEKLDEIFFSEQPKPKGHYEESFERGGVSRFGDIQAIGTTSWFTKTTDWLGKPGGKEKEKEEEKVDDVRKDQDQDVEMGDGIPLSSTTQETLPAPAPIPVSISVPAPAVEAPKPLPTAEEISKAHEEEIGSRIARITERMIENANTAAAATNATVTIADIPVSVPVTDGLNALASLADGAREKEVVEYRNMSSPRPPSMSPVSPIREGVGRYSSPPPAEGWGRRS